MLYGKLTAAYYENYEKHSNISCNKMYSSYITARSLGN